MTSIAHGGAAEVPRPRTLWFGLLGGGLAWKLQLMVNYAVVPYACWRDVGFVIHLASLATFLLSLAAAWVAYGSWRATGQSYELEIGGPLGRSRFMGLLGAVLGVFFALIILGQWIPNLIVGACDGIT